MTEGHGTCGQASGGRNRPQRGRTTSCLATVRPLRGRLRECVSYPQVPFPSVIPPAVIHIRPLRGRQDATCESSVNKKRFLQGCYSSKEPFFLLYELYVLGFNSYLLISEPTYLAHIAATRYVTP